MIGCPKRPPRLIKVRGSDFSLVPSNPFQYRQINEAIMESLPSLRKHMAWAHLPQSEEGQYRRLIESQYQYFKGTEYCFSLMNQDRFIGSFGLHRRTGGPFGLELGYWVRTTEQNKGFATIGSKILAFLAFEYLDCKRLQITYNKLNLVSQKVAQKVGFIREAELQRYEMMGDRNMKKNGYISSDLTYMDRLLAPELPKLEWYHELKPRLEILQS